MTIGETVGITDLDAATGEAQNERRSAVMVGNSAYVFSAFAIPPMLMVVVAAVAFLRLLAKGAVRTSPALTVMILGAAAWQGSFAMMALAADARTATAWARMGCAFLPLLAPATYQFVVNILRIAARRRVIAQLAWVVGILLGVLGFATDSIVTSVRAFRWGFFPVFSIPASAISILFFGGLLLASTWELTHAHPQAHGLEQKRLGLLRIATAIGTLAALDFLVARTSLVPIGGTAWIATIAIATYAIAKYGPQPMTPALAAKEIIGTMRDVLLVSDRDGRIEFANSGACATLGYTPDEFIGRQLEDFLVPTPFADTTLRTRSIRDTEYVFRTRSGEHIELSVSRSPVLRHSETAGSVLIGRDLRDRKRYETEIRRAVTLLQSTIESTADGILAIGAEGEILRWNRRLIDMWRIPRRLTGSDGAGAWIEHMATQLTDPAEFLSSVASVELQPDVEVRHVLELADGRRFEQYSVGRSAGKWPLWVWSFRDVTAQRRAEEALRNSEARYRLLFEQNAAGACVATIRGDITDCNATFAALVGALPGHLLQRNLADLFARPAEWETITRRLEDSAVVQGVETELRRGEGSVWVLQNFAVLGGDGAAVLHLTAVDITDRKRAEAQIEHYALHDVLTQLPNRRLLRDRLDLSILAARRSHRFVGALFIDLDGFKNVNDTLGHGVGDAVLCEVADRLRSVVRKTDTVARFGGDEFTVLLPDLNDPQDATFVAQKIVDAVERPIDLAVPAIELSASIGVAVFPRDAQDSDELLQCADEAMYRVKDLRRTDPQNNGAS